MELPYKKDSLTGEPYHYYLEQYRKSSAYSISERLQIPFCEEDNSFRIRFLGETYKVTHPNFDITHETEENGIYILEDKVQAKILLLRFLLEGDAAMYLGKLLSYRDLPWGEVYYKQFQGRCIQRLARSYGNQTDKFSVIMQGLHGCKKEYGDAAYEFELLNGIHLCFILWEGDEEFPPSAQILFSDNFPAAFWAEDAAYIGDIVMEYMKRYEKRKINVTSMA